MLLIFLIYLTVQAPQECLSLGEVTYWNGSTLNNSRGVTGQSTITMTKKGSNRFHITDITAGYLNYYGFGDLESTIEIDCGGQVVPQQFETPYGSCTLSGNLSADGSLTLYWAIPYNEVDEATLFQQIN